MLTMDETIAAIKSLDTEPDIIERACIYVAFGDINQHGEGIDKIASDMVIRYSKDEDPVEFMMASLKACASCAVAVCGAGKETLMIETLIRSLRNYFGEAHKNKILFMIEDDPNEALEAMKAFILGVAEAKDRGR